MAFEACAFDRCLECGSIYRTRERLAADPALYEGGYHTGKRSRRWAHRVRKAARQLEDALALAPGGSVLDVGCSTGYVVAAGLGLGLRAAGTDISLTACQAAQAKGLDVRQGSEAGLPFEAGSFDLVVMRHVLEHTPRPHQLLAEVSRVLTSAGAVLVLVPDPGYWKARRSPRTYRYYRPDDLGRQHAVYYTVPSLSRLLAMNGYRVLADQKFAPRPGQGPLGRLLGWAWRLVARLGLRRELYLVARKDAAVPAPPPSSSA